MKNRIFSISTGAGFLPSAAWDVMQAIERLNSKLSSSHWTSLQTSPRCLQFTRHVFLFLSTNYRHLYPNIDLNKIHPKKSSKSSPLPNSFRKPLPVSFRSESSSIPTNPRFPVVSPWHLARRWRRQRHFGIFGLHTATWNWGRKFYDHQESWR